MMNKNLPKVTVVTVTYNAEQYLEQTIKSVIEQDYSNIEYIIIDGGSIDGTVDIIKKYEKYISYWVSEPDKGIYDAMNKGTDVATGEWINFMNAGDSFFNKNIIKYVIDVMEEETNLIYGGINTFFKDSSERAYEAPGKISNIFKRHPYNHQASFLRMYFAKRYQFSLKYKYASDVEQMLEIYKYEDIRVKVIDKPLINFLMGGFWQQNAADAHLEILNIMRPYLNKPSDIFRHSSYIALRNLDENPNVYFATLVNRFIQEIVNFQESSLALYGDGNITKLIMPFLEDKVKVIFDKSVDHKLEGKIIKDNPKNIKMYDFEKLIITVMGREDEITQYLVDDLKVSRDLVVTFDLSSKGSK